jgi:hypothetical protein
MKAFIVNDQEFGWDEIVLAAQIWGEWRPFFETARQSLACLRQGEKSGRLPDASETREVANGFRYAHNLISADETRSWLCRRGITIESWMDYLRGQVLRERWALQLEKIVADNPVGNQEVAKVIQCYAICADKLDEWSLKLAGRAAVAANSGLFENTRDPSTGSSEDFVCRIEAEFQLQRQRTITSKLIDAEIADHRLDWVRVDSRYIWFGEERIAREAALCLALDGLTLEQVAHDAHGLVQQWNFYLDEIEPPARSHFLSARQGDSLGPIKMIEGFPLFSIVAKTMPAADDPEIRDRAEHAIIAGVMEQSINERVRWLR